MYPAPSAGTVTAQACSTTLWVGLYSRAMCGYLYIALAFLGQHPLDSPDAMIYECFSPAYVRLHLQSMNCKHAWRLPSRILTGGTSA